MSTYALSLGKNNKIIPIFKKKKLANSTVSSTAEWSPQSPGGVFLKHCLRIIEVVDKRETAILKDNLEIWMV